MPLKQSNKYFKTILTISLAGLVALSPFAIDTYIAAMPMMATYFGVEISVVELTITLYFLGFAFGNFFGGPLSDSFGRKTIAFTGIIVYGTAALLIPLSHKIEYIIVLRVIQAFGGGFATVTANVFVRDWYEGKDVARFITIITMIMMLAPLFAPVVGVVLINWKGWQSIFYFLSAFAFFLSVIFLFIVPESRDKSFITRKITFQQMFGKYRLFFSHKQSVLMLFAISLSMSGMYLFLTAASFIYIKFFGIEKNQFPIVFGANVVLNIILSLLNTVLLKKHRPRNILRVGLLIQLFAGIWLFTAVLAKEPSFWAVFSGIVLFIGSLGLVFGNGTAVILNHNPKVSGSANATIGIARFVLSFFIGSILAIFHTGDLIPIGAAMLFCSLMANLLFEYSIRRKALD